MLDSAAQSLGHIQQPVVDCTALPGEYLHHLLVIAIAAVTHQFGGYRIPVYMGAHRGLNLGIDATVVIAAEIDLGSLFHQHYLRALLGSRAGRTEAAHTGTRYHDIRVYGLADGAVRYRGGGFKELRLCRRSAAAALAAGHLPLSQMLLPVAAAREDSAAHHAQCRQGTAFQETPAAHVDALVLPHLYFLPA